MIEEKHQLRLRKYWGRGGGGKKKRFIELHINLALDSNENLPFSLSFISGFESWFSCSSRYRETRLLLCNVTKIKTDAI